MTFYWFDANADLSERDCVKVWGKEDNKTTCRLLRNVNRRYTFHVTKDSSYNDCKTEISLIFNQTCNIPLSLITFKYNEKLCMKTYKNKRCVEAFYPFRYSAFPYPQHVARKSGNHYEDVSGWSSGVLECARLQYNLEGPGEISNEVHENNMEMPSFTCFVMEFQNHQIHYFYFKDHKQSNVSCATQGICSTWEEWSVKILELDPDVIVSHQWTWLSDAHASVGDRSSFESPLQCLSRSVLPEFFDTRKDTGEDKPSYSLLFRWIETRGAGRILLSTFELAQLWFPKENDYSLESLDKISKTPLDACWNLLVSNDWIYITYQFAVIAKCSWQTALSSYQHQLLEALFVHKFHHAGAILPENPNFKVKGSSSFKEEWENHKKNEIQCQNKGFGITEDSYTGGLVLESQKGKVVGNMILFDFQSFFTSIIEEYNVCFSTIKIKDKEKEEKDNSSEVGGEEIKNKRVRKTADDLATTVEFVAEEIKVGIIPILITELKKKRKECQDARLALVYKLMTNKVYGYLGFQSSRFYNPILAAFITMKSRFIMQSSCNKIKSQEAEWKWSIIYGDTDSILPLVPSDVTISMVQELMTKFINEEMKLKYIKIQAQKQIKQLYMVTKKTFALKGREDKNWDIKGLIMIRRDIPDIAKKMGFTWLDEIFSNNKVTEQSVKQSIDSIIQDWLNPNDIILKEYVMRRHFMDFSTPASEPHGIVARRWNKTRTSDRPYVTKDWVPYIQTKTGPKHPSECSGIEEIDFSWYIFKCFLPITRDLLKPLGLNISDDKYINWWSKKSSCLNQSLHLSSTWSNVSQSVSKKETISHNDIFEIKENKDKLSFSVFHPVPIE